MIELPSLEKDHWQLASAEQAHANAPETFWIPEASARQQLERGAAAKLLFEIALLDESGHSFVQVERMWVIVSTVQDGQYIGILDSNPVSVAPEEGQYLVVGAEIPFEPAHIADIAQPPEDYVAWQLGQPPERSWRRFAAEDPNRIDVDR
ncbi:MULTISPECIES: hypothetical protein [unclassified Halomonas]|uniref:hypothetical protein n=1 Tax=unclassified Halomonas TaxID=2609666 RepID=UPI0020768D40|nr:MULTISPECIES: hypothetical protein [unclassified Halomonas]